ncbi:zinc metallochaperone AztD [Paradevosia shaoguanensis]|uniref:zinc metallochaperone AztD n=1 Tax=Paradevosia shaoguanensis TaxID=1335043 RepID=UPI00193220AB|nr:zinc metallochaperone AztD [Paradevosia shaoguanensis]
MRYVPSTLAALAVLAIPASAFAEEEVAWRLFVADHDQPRVTAIDLESGAALDSFAIDGPATLYATKGKRAVYAVQGEQNRVAIIASGVEIEDHGDHGDLKLGEPALTDAVLTGERPVHFVEHDDQFAIFYDGEGTARIYPEAAVLKGDTAFREVHTSAPHHGVAIPMEDYTLVTQPNEADPKALPTGIWVLDAAGEKLGDFHPCPDLHGEATSGNLLAIACGTGLLLAKEGASGPQIEFLPYAADLPPGKVTTLLGGSGFQYFLGNYGADRVAVIDPSATDAFQLVTLPTRRVHFAVDPEQPKFAYVFTEDGNLLQLDILSAAITGTLHLTEPYSMDGEWNLPRPRVAVAGGEIAVTDPLKRLIHVVDAKAFAKTREIAVEGRPYNIVAVGGAGETHGHHHHH